MATSLDSRIIDALTKVNNPSGSEDFDINAYGAAFHQSAWEKARTVLDLLGKQDCPFHGWKPVFVSVGGADGAELDFLLSNSIADDGILIEYNRFLAQAARERTAKLPINKKIVVIEGAAQEKIGESMEEAYNIVRQGAAQFVAVTCHAVIHELFDRGKIHFDAIGFFGQIFSDADIPLWFSYREPGRPEKWRDEVLLSANCSRQNLLALANAICLHHDSLARLTPKPNLVGDGVRMNSTLAMEVLAKLFYIDDLVHEIDERSTAVDHKLLVNALHVAIGESARRTGRCEVASVSAPSDSFKKNWQDYGVRIQGLTDEFNPYELPVAESHTRVTAWRQPLRKASVPAVTRENGELHGPSEVLAICKMALEQGDITLLEASLANSGRYWIESAAREHARGLFVEIQSTVARSSKAYVLARFLNALPDLFNDTLGPSEFSEEAEDAAGRHGLGLLLKAERMEYARKNGDLPRAVTVANSLLLEAETYQAASPLERYQHGTVMFLLGNLLREGGRYIEALTYVERAELSYIKGIPSHNTELAHCEYASLACRAMRGDASLKGSSYRSMGQEHRFASALIQLSFSHAAWLLNDPERAIAFADDSARNFGEIHFLGHAKRAQATRNLLQTWQELEAGKAPDLSVFQPFLANTLSCLTGANSDLSDVKRFVIEQRPGRALGLLQFTRNNSAVLDRELDIEISPLIDITKDGWSLKSGMRVRSLREADQVLRKEMGIELGQKVPFLP